MPFRLPRTSGEALIYGLHEIQTIAQRFFESPLVPSRQWIDILLQFTYDSGFCERTTWTSERFCSFYLKSPKVKWGESIEKLVRIVLVLPAYSGVAERSSSGFFGSI